jgi:SAM-dependent methyltransferase
MTASVRPPAWQDRERWIALLEELFDPATVRRLERIGVAPGWHVLDVGAGGGSIARWLARQVHPGGEVVATDLDTTLLDPLDQPSLQVIRHDVLSDDFPPASFDLIHCRAVLVHLSEPGRALARMAEWLRPGGVLVAEEPWLDIGLLSPDPAMVRATQELRRAGDMDCGFARRLPIALAEAGLDRIEAEGELRFFDGGSRLSSFFVHVVDGVTGPLAADVPEARSELDRMRERFADPACCDCGWPRIAAWGRKPPGPGP